MAQTAEPLKWSEHIIVLFDSLFAQWSIENAILSNKLGVRFSTFAFDKFKESFNKENDFIQYIHLLVNALTVSLKEVPNNYPSTLMNMLELSPAQKHYNIKAMPTLILSNFIFFTAHNKWIKKVCMHNLVVDDTYHYQSSKAYCHFAFLADELKKALIGYKYFEDFLTNLKEHIKRSLEGDNLKLFKEKVYPLIMSSGFPPQKEWNIDRIFKAIDFDSGGSLSKDELKEGLIGLFNVSMTQSDINNLMGCFTLDKKGDIGKEEFCSKMIIDPHLWVDPIFVFDRARFLEFIYEEWNGSITKQKSDLGKIIEEAFGRNKEIDMVSFNQLLYKINGDSFAGQIYKYYTNSEEMQVKSLPVDSVISIIMENHVGGYTLNFFKDYVDELFPLMKLLSMKIS